MPYLPGQDRNTVTRAHDERPYVPRHLDAPYQLRPGELGLYENELWYRRGDGPPVKLCYVGHLERAGAGVAGPTIVSGGLPGHGHDHDTDLINVSADDHHAQSHVLADTSDLGADHTTSGLTIGQVLRAYGATTARFEQLAHSDLGSVSADQHHAQQHGVLTAADHTTVDATIRLDAEYPGAALTCSGSNNDPGNEGMTSDVWTSGHDNRNYYEWQSDTVAGLQSYDVFEQWQVPWNFDSFQVGANEALTLDICTEETAGTNNAIDITIRKEGTP